jgi:hypothetical protein
MADQYYPSKFKVGELHDDFRRLYDHMYAQQRTNAELEGRLRDMTEKHGKLAQQVAQGPSTTKILGIPVTAQPPQDGQKLTYSKAIGGFIFE